MYHHSKHGMIAGASALAMFGPGVRAPEVKDADLGAMQTEVKSAIEGVIKAHDEFKSKNDQRLTQLEKKGEDGVTKDELEKINKALDDAIAAVKQRQDEVEAKANRLSIHDGGQMTAAEAKQIADFHQLIGLKDFNRDQLAEYKSDLEAHLRNPRAKATTLMVGSDPAGGYWVTPDKTGRMIKKLYETTPMRQLANVVTIGTDSLEGPIDNGEGDAEWAGEVTPRNQTDLPKTGMWKIEVHELYAYPKVTQKLLEDATIDVEGWISDKSISKFARKENNAYCMGDGQLKPRGIFTYDMAEASDETRPWGTFQFVKTGANGGYGASGSDKILDMIFELKSGYRQGAKFLMARRTMAATRKLKDGQGNYLASLRLADGALVETIFGFGVSDGEDAPKLSDNGYAMAFGDFAEAYIIVDRLGVTVIRDNITQPGFVKYNMRKRTGGGAVNFEAVKFLKFST